MNASLILVGKLAGTAALATGALVTGISATHASTAAPTAAKQVHCGRGLAHASAQLKSDLEAARGEPAGKERRQAVTKIRRDARQGTYGDAAQVASLRRQVAQLRFRAQAPDSLKSALKTARSEPAGAARKAALQQVRKDAAAGTYGDKIEKIATKRADHRQACATQHQERKDSKQQKSS